MAVFDMITNPPPHLIAQADAISESHFTVDTADMQVVHQWLDFNPHIVTHAVLDGKVLGFFNIMPLTRECGQLFEQEAIKEEDLRVEHMLPHDMLMHAQYAYIAAIAVKDPQDYVNRQCTAALVACMADLLRTHYGTKRPPVKIFANSTTFEGNRIVNKLGLEPIKPFSKELKETSIHMSVLDDAACRNLEGLSRRYERFIGENPWRSEINA